MNTVSSAAGCYTKENKRPLLDCRDVIYSHII